MALSENSGVIALLEQLIRCRSITPNDAGCQQILADRLRALGFVCESMPFGDVSNLYARRGNTGPVLCFAGHTDVVPPGADNEWSSDPFEPNVRDGAIYARGAADMKGGLAAMIVALEEFVAEHSEHRGSLAVLSPATRKVAHAMARSRSSKLYRRAARKLIGVCLENLPVKTRWATLFVSAGVDH
jgi:acetylornithine deacetylase/succinyl-diaminopimelate desuccinylase-like protein